jgi:hypothetical protein
MRACRRTVSRIGGLLPGLFDCLLGLRVLVHLRTPCFCVRNPRGYSEFHHASTPGI